jgi:hypothetical protein
MYLLRGEVNFALIGGGLFLLAFGFGAKSRLSQ